MTTLADSENDLSGVRAAAGLVRVPVVRFLALCALFLIYDFGSYFLPAALGQALVFLHAAALVLVALMNMYWGLLFLCVSLVFADDIPRVDADAGSIGLYSLLTVPVAGVAVGNFVILAVCGIGIFSAVSRWSRCPRRPMFTYVDGCILGIAALYAIATLHGFRWLPRNFRGVVNDLNLPLMNCLLFLTVRLYVDTAEKVKDLWSALFEAMAAKTAVWTLWFFLSVGITLGSRFRVSGESGRVLLVFVLAYSLTLLQKNMKLPRRQWLLAVGVALAASFNLLFDASRGPWLMSAYALIVLLALGRLRDKVRWCVIGGLCVSTAAIGLWSIRPESYRAIGYFWSTMEFWKEGNVARSESTMVRVYEFKNIHAQLVDHDNLILGEGPGSLFTDRYAPFPFGLDDSDFTFEERRQRLFQNPHGLLPNLLLNLGYVGMVIYLTLMALLYAFAFKAFRRLKVPSLKAVALSILSFLPAIVYMSWSPKINMFVGFFFGVIGSLHILSRSDEKAPRHSGQEQGYPALRRAETRARPAVPHENGEEKELQT